MFSLCNAYDDLWDDFEEAIDLRTLFNKNRSAQYSSYLNEHYGGTWKLDGNKSSIFFNPVSNTSLFNVPTGRAKFFV